MIQTTTSSETICLCCFGSKIVKSGYAFKNQIKPCPLCHGGKLKDADLIKVNQNYQELIDEIAEDNEVDEQIHDFNDH